MAARERGGGRRSLEQVVREFEARTGSEVLITRIALERGKPLFNALTQTLGADRKQIHIALNADLTNEYAATVIEDELREVEGGRKEVATAENILNLLQRLVDAPERPEIAVCTFVIPERELPEGILIRSAALAWQSMVEDFLRDKWHEVYKIDPRLFEEIIAGAYERSGLYDEVILTPRSNDKGRDIIATKKGFSGFRVIGSVKRYAPRRLIKRAEVDELLGTLYRDPNASKGILTTTSDFAPGLSSEPTFSAMIPNRLELVNGDGLKKLFKDLLLKNPVRR